MSEELKSATEKQPKDRSPSFPYIGLSKAFERTQQFYEYAKKFDSRIADAAKPAWNMGPKSSSTLQTVAALLAYGLAEDSGSGDNRKIKVSDLAYRALVDQREGAKEAALAEAALKPKLIAEYAKEWGIERPPEANCLSELTLDRGFTPEGAKAFLRVYDDTIVFAEAASADKAGDSAPNLETTDISPSGDIKIGDAVRLEVAGQIMAEKAKVRAVKEHDSQKWLFVEGSETGVLISNATLLEKAPLAPLAVPTMPLARNEEAPSPSEELDRFTVDEGVVKITFPAEMAAASVEDLEDFFELFIKKAKRRAGVSIT